MDLKKLEKAVREAAQRNARQPMLAAVTGAGQTDLDLGLPQEFAAAARSLTERLQKGMKRGETADAEAAPWV